MHLVESGFKRCFTHPEFTKPGVWGRVACFACSRFRACQGRPYSPFKPAMLRVRAFLVKAGRSEALVLTALFGAAVAFVAPAQSGVKPQALVASSKGLLG